MHILALVENIFLKINRMIKEASERPLCDSDEHCPLLHLCSDLNISGLYVKLLGTLR